MQVAKLPARPERRRLDALETCAIRSFSQRFHHAVSIDNTPVRRVRPVDNSPGLCSDVGPASDIRNSRDRGGPVAIAVAADRDLLQRVARNDRAEDTNVRIRSAAVRRRRHSPRARCAFCAVGGRRGSWRQRSSRRAWRSSTGPSSTWRCRRSSGSLNASLVDVQWVVEAYALFLAALLLAGGAAGDRFGRRRVFCSASRCSPRLRSGADSRAAFASSSSRARFKASPARCWFPRALRSSARRSPSAIVARRSARGRARHR